jgi:hypothetical protein
MGETRTNSSGSPPKRYNSRSRSPTAKTRGPVAGIRSKFSSKPFIGVASEKYGDFSVKSKTSIPQGSLNFHSFIDQNHYAS